jgi:4-amino-4-deoxychorismate lyase
MIPVDGILVDGKPANSIPADDRGLAYGDGLFETIEIAAGQPVLWNRHMRRLMHGCHELGIQYHDDAQLLHECLALAEGYERGIIKIILTRGSGGRGYRPDASCKARRIVSFHAWPDYAASHTNKGIRLFRCKTPVTVNYKLAGLKTLCRLEQVMAQREWSEETFAEGLMLAPGERVIEGTRSNVFAVKDQVLLTPALKSAGINGIMRDVIIEMAKHAGLAVQELDLAHDTFRSADEIFVCNSIIRVWPVIEYMDARYQRGPVTTRIMNMIESQLGEYE